MEVEIDPLSMLEQTMQVNDYSVTSNGDQDIVCLSDGSEDPSLEVNLPEVTYSEDSPLVLGTMPNGAVILDPARNDLAYVLEPMQTLQEEPPINLHEDETMGFGEHFLVNPGPSTSAGPSSQSCSPPPSHSPSERIVRGRGRGSRASRGSNRGKRGGAYSRNTVINGINRNHGGPVTSNRSPEDALVSSAKLVNNVKRLNFVSSEEQSYRFKIYNEYQKVLKSRLDCTVCGTHIGCTIDLNVFYITHPLLKVLSCSSCRDKYCKTDWTLGPANKDFLCRWCASSGHRRTLKNCSNCPFAFCESCITRNYSKRDCSRVMNNANWLCYVCQMVPLYYLRATVWALGNFINSLNRRRFPALYKKDMSFCCTPTVETNDCSIDLEDDDDYAIVPETQPTVSCLAVSSRVDILFSNIETIQQAVKTKLAAPVYVDGIDELVSNINLSLAKIGRNVESCLEYIENWRIHSIDQYKKEAAKKLEEKKKQEEARRKASLAIKGKKNVNGSPDYSQLFKQYNIKPCRVLLERLDIREETSKPPDFFLSLVPSPPAVQEVIEVFEEEDDDDIIWVDDKK